MNPSATEQDLYEALHKASCDGLLSRAENGLDTMIGEGGLKLSGGENKDYPLPVPCFAILIYCCLMKLLRHWILSQKKKLPIPSEAFQH